ncbi:PREDICTED: uncharacterized protein LOC105556639 [Vollenhovia emeryi]|uniref:uncharacterized protein LOC105556639 n=1 Tax=Vollenhovia emeryi TaxID=411798 RepID=UPI0005F46D48|nr:PREDICTED: uncharacterized protein LOC105556639 [Vollenhovia emeryi]
MAYLKEIVYMLNKQFVEIRELKKCIGEKEAAENQKPENKDCVNWAKLLPFNSIDDMANFCKKLETKENYVESMIKLLKSVGGKDDRNKVNKMMEKVITNTLDEKFSRKGQKGKLVFENCKVEQIIVGIP